MKISTGIGIGAIAACLFLAAIIAFDQNRLAKAEGFLDIVDKLAASNRGISEAGRWHSFRVEEEENAREVERQKNIADRPLLACFAAQSAVKERLSRSGTFPSCLEGHGVIAEKTAGDFTVRSYVSLPDASGILRSHSYVVRVHHDPVGKTFATIIQQLE
jgi:hypothetical protein